jgi:hypothetical protein
VLPVPESGLDCEVGVFFSGDSVGEGDTVGAEVRTAGFWLNRGLVGAGASPGARVGLPVAGAFTGDGTVGDEAAGDGATGVEGDIDVLMQYLPCSLCQLSSCGVPIVTGSIVWFVGVPGANFAPWAQLYLMPSGLPSASKYPN